MEEFLDKVRQSQYWKKHFDNIPPQMFTLETLNTFNMYPIGYDDHIIEYLPFFWEEVEWDEHGYKSLADAYENLSNKKKHTLEIQRLLGKEYAKPPFPADPDHSYYAEKPCQVIVALETNTPTYFDAINIVNHGAISNLPADAIVDVPGIAIGGEVRSIHIGELPIGPMEICRRQITLHEIIAQAAHEGNDSLAIQALCLDPYVRSLSQARNIWTDFRKEYKDYLITFK
jgi:alpha-galactosidase/6-phospho-beta-glucosidase family protein